MEAGNEAAGLEMLRESLELAKEDGGKDMVGIVLHDFANHYMGKGEMKKAAGQLRKALAAFRAHEFYLGMTFVQEDLSTLFEKEGQLDSALHYSRMSAAGKDSMLHLSKIQDAERKETEYKLGKKMLADSLLAVARFQEAALRADNQAKITTSLVIGVVLLGILLVTLGFALRTKIVTNRRIQRSVKEKEMLIKEIHHRVKNNLTMVSNLLELQGRSVEHEDARVAIGEGQNRLKSIALIHQQLYRDDEKTTIAFLDFVEELVGELAFAYGSEAAGVEIQTRVEQMELDVEVAIPLG
ncbi:MAG: histidine kinase dimerization/phosphoacceptor domain -containing protein, partial [Bacteroidota bacterium]